MHSHYAKVVSNHGLIIIENFYRLGILLKKNKTSFLKTTVIKKDAPPILSRQKILDSIEQLGLMNVLEDGADAVNGRICREHG